MAHRIPTAKQPRRGALYSREEMVVLRKYKDEYKEQTTRPLRANVMRKILVDIFNHWNVLKTLPSDEATCVEWIKVTTD
jgi:hypothetical protein